MRHYFKIPKDTFGQVRFFKAIDKIFFDNAEAHRTNTGGHIFFEGFYMSQRVFEAFTRNADQVSISEYRWRPTSASPISSTVVMEMEMKDGKFYNIRFLQKGADVMNFMGVSGMDFYLVFDDEKVEWF